MKTLQSQKFSARNLFWAESIKNVSKGILRRKSRNWKFFSFKIFRLWTKKNFGSYEKWTRPITPEILISQKISLISKLFRLKRSTKKVLMNFLRNRYLKNWNFGFGLRKIQLPPKVTTWYNWPRQSRVKVPRRGQSPPHWLETPAGVRAPAGVRNTPKGVTFFYLVRLC